VLGIEDHRGQRDTAQDPKAADGYVRQDYAIALAEKAGFTFIGSSEINANPKDTANPTFSTGAGSRRSLGLRGSKKRVGSTTGFENRV
jgi:predicted methyltransferase